MERQIENLVKRVDELERRMAVLEFGANVPSPESPTTAESQFDRCMSIVFKKEGGVADRPLADDPGGLTNMGITIGTYVSWLQSNDEYRGMAEAREALRDGLTRQEARAIYLELFWNKIKGDDLPVGVDLVVFDAAVNSGPAQAARWLQRAVDVADDGIIGPLTLEAVVEEQALYTINHVCDQRLDFMRSLSNWTANKNGWANRVEHIRETAIRWLV